MFGTKHFGLRGVLQTYCILDGFNHRPGGPGGAAAPQRRFQSDSDEGQKTAAAKPEVWSEQRPRLGCGAPARQVDVQDPNCL